MNVSADDLNGAKPSADIVLIEIETYSAVPL